MIKEKANGAIFNCPEYIKCPVCYGCRNYNPSYRACRELCGEKKDSCDTKRHQANLLGKFYKVKPIYQVNI